MLGAVQFFPALVLSLECAPRPGGSVVNLSFHRAPLPLGELHRELNGLSELGVGSSPLYAGVSYN